MSQTPLQDICPLLDPLAPKLQIDLVSKKSILRDEEEKLGDLIVLDQDVLSQRYLVIFAKANVAYAQFKIDWLNKLLTGKLT